MDYFRLYSEPDTTLVEWRKLLNIMSDKWGDIDLEPFRLYSKADTTLIQWQKLLNMLSNKVNESGGLSNLSSGIPWVKIVQPLPYVDLLDSKVSVSNAFTMWDRTLVQESDNIDWVDLNGNDLLTTNSISFKFDDSQSVTIEPFNFESMRIFDTPTITIT